MPAKGTSTGPRLQWLSLIITGINVLGQDVSNQRLESWLRMEATSAWKVFSSEMPVPGTLKNYFTDARKFASGLDRPWSIGQTVSARNGEVISSEALPLVLQLWQRSLIGGRTLTVRQALWCARLFSVHAMSVSGDSEHDDSWLETVYTVSTLYAAREQISETNSESGGAETSDLDAVLAFGMSMLNNTGYAYAADKSLDLAVELGMVPVPGQTVSDLLHIRIDDEPIRILREAVIEEVPNLKVDGFDPKMASRFGYWRSMYLTLGIRALMACEDWVSISGQEQKMRATMLGTLIAESDWVNFFYMCRWKSSDWNGHLGGENVD